MLYPRMNAYRQVVDLSGFWDFRFDPEDRGEAVGWTTGFGGGRPIAVPASWNDQFEEGRDFLGPAWYKTTFTLAPPGPGRAALLRFDSVNYTADVWLNGGPLGSHEGGHLPFVFDVTGALRGTNHLVVRVDGRLAPDRVPPGNIAADGPDSFGNVQWPAGSFDFFPFCGIHRPVTLSFVPECRIDSIRVDTTLKGQDAWLSVRVGTQGPGAHRARLRLVRAGTAEQTEMEIGAQGASAEIEVPQAALWAPGAPHLYDLTIELEEGGITVDQYCLPVGLRTVRVEADALLLNGKRIYLKGFGRHEDFPVTGRGLVPAVVVKDFALMGWVGANSFRTTHYPYSEQMMDLADRLGYLVIDETPAVGLFFRPEGLERRLQLCRDYVTALIERDAHHPSVIAWSLANEPHSRRPEAGGFFRVLYDLAKRLDPTRPVTLASYIGVGEEAFEFCDLVCLNRYFGWYTESGRIEEGCLRLSEELDALARRYGKPILLSEFGADTIPGCHALPPEMFSEEYQAQMLESYIAVLRSKPYVVGEHVWNLCDFKTSQEVKRFGGMNLKGVFTRDRRPKMAAHQLRRLWGTQG